MNSALSIALDALIRLAGLVMQLFKDESSEELKQQARARLDRLAALLQSHDAVAQGMQDRLDAAVPRDAA